jgi:hypothetical protein
MSGKKAERGPDGKFIVPLTLPEWLIRKIVLQVRAAKRGAIGLDSKEIGSSKISLCSSDFAI